MLFLKINKFWNLNRIKIINYNQRLMNIRINVSSQKINFRILNQKSKIQTQTYKTNNP